MSARDYWTEGLMRNSAALRKRDSEHKEMRRLNWLEEHTSTGPVAKRWTKGQTDCSDGRCGDGDRASGDTNQTDFKRIFEQMADRLFG